MRIEVLTFANAISTSSEKKRDKYPKHAGTRVTVMKVISPSHPPQRVQFPLDHCQVGWLVGTPFVLCLLLTSFAHSKNMERSRVQDW